MRAIVPGLFAAVTLAAMLLRDRAIPRLLRPWMAALLAALLMATPFLLPGDALLGRAIAAGFAISMGAKIRMLLDREEVDRKAVSSFPRFLLWLLVPAATHWPEKTAEAARLRRTGARRLVRAVAKGSLMVGAIAIKTMYPGMPLVAAALLTALEFYAFLSGLADVVGGVAMGLTGIHVDEVFKAPFLSVSPADFWANRWNLFIGRFARRYVFLPIAQREGAILALVAAFVSSGLVHEYLVLACLGPGAYVPGLMLAFFAVQIPAVLIAGRLERRHRRIHGWRLALAMGLTIAWFTVTSPLFFLPLRPVIDGLETSVTRAISRPISTRPG